MKHPKYKLPENWHEIVREALEDAEREERRLRLAAKVTDLSKLDKPCDAALELKRNRP